ncbi:MAG: cyclodeaminase/cyclohydrolase family protein [Candidatus Muirbacterium halophilum]|nr:cyclodeaminase/cyclohydrolase family protein [Candidatus Muirbacterium halophilum]MCK9475695.1 cyclodeaminase/cyclohydrolase family protein [Candidatus Muirbacterium halophilum]
MLEKMNLFDFAFNVGNSKNPPGGGASACYVANLGISLIRMSCVIILKNNDNVKDIFYNYIEKLDLIKGNLFILMNKDSYIFEKFLKFEELSNEYKEKVVLESCEIPLEIIENILIVFSLTEEITQNYINNTECDIMSGVDFLKCALNACCYNVLFNIEFLNSIVLKGKISNKMNCLKKQSNLFYKNIKEKLNYEKI